MPLQLEDRLLGRVVVLKCAGRIVAGAEAQALEAHVHRICADCRDLVLDVAEVNFIDSSGLGMLVRLMSRIRRSGGDLKVCAPATAIRHLLTLTNLLPVFDVHDSEVSSLAAFYGRSRPAEGKAEVRARGVLCIHPSVDTLIYLREVLRRSGYDAVTTSNLSDAIVLLKATAPALVILADEMQSPRGRATAAILREIRPDVPVIPLPADFSREGGRGGELAAAGSSVSPGNRAGRHPVGSARYSTASGCSIGCAQFWSSGKEKG
jgi:anti-sigma B factor antagonist